MTPNNRKRNTLALAVKTAAGIFVTTWAVQAGAQSLVLEEIVVTAQKRTESLQDVPVAVTAISGEKITSAGIQGLEDLTAYVPNVSMFTQPGGGSPSAIYIRGIGSGNNVAFEQSVGMFVDGVYSGRSRQYLVPFLDMGSVEVLKGPQGALFGKNTVAGAMILNSARPTDTFEGELRGQYEFEYGTQEYVGVVSGPLTDRLSGRLAGKYQEVEGFMDNLVRDMDAPEVENSSIRGSLLYDPTDSVQIYAKVEYSEQDATGSTNQMTNLAGSFRGLVDHTDVLTPLENGRFDDKQTGDSWNLDVSKTDSLNAAVQLDWELDNHTFTSLTGYSDYDSETVLDGDMTDLYFVEQNSFEDFEQLSQEFRLSSAGGETLDYIVGVYLETQELKSNAPTNLSLVALSAVNVPGSPVPPVELALVAPYEQDADTAAVFGQLTWHISDDWALTGGVRYSHETKDAMLTTYTADFGSLEPTDSAFLQVVASQLLGRVDAVLEDDRTSDNTSYSVNLTWDYSDDGMAYLRTARGYKSGGFNPNQGDGDIDAFEYDDEEVNSVELGAKMTLLGGAATLNLAAFYTELTDLQVSSFTDNGFVVGNAAESTSKGVEAEGRLMVSEHLSFALSLAYLSSEYDDFPGAACDLYQVQAPDPVAAGCIGYDGTQNSGLQNRAGQTTDRAPEWSGTFITNFFYPVGDAMEFRANLDVLYEDDLGENLSQNYQDSYFKVNARLGLGSVNDTWEVALLGKNLTDEVTYTNGAGAPFFTGSWFKGRTAPRTVALDLSYRF